MEFQVEMLQCRFKRTGIMLLAANCLIFAKWEPTGGPYGGSISAIGADGSTIIAATSQGCIYLKNDGAPTWSSIKDGLNIVNAVLAADGVLLAGITDMNRNGVIIRSTDGGNNWSETFNTPKISTTYKLIHVNNMIFATFYGSGVFRSDDTGQTWIDINNGLPNFNVDAITEYEGDIYLGVSQDVYRSSDYGQNWEKISPRSLIYLPKAPTSMVVWADTVYVGSLARGVYIMTKTDSGWVYTDSALSGTNVYQLLYSNNKLFAGTDQKGVLVSTDRGISWSTFNKDTLNKKIGALAVKDDSLLAGTEYGFFKTSHNAPDWKLENSGLLNSYVIRIAVSGDTLFAATAYSGIHRSFDNGENWVAVNNGLPTSFFYDVILHDGQLYAGSYKNGLYRSGDYGESWTPDTRLPDSSTVASIVSCHDVLLLFTSNGIYRSTDHADTLERVAQTELLTGYISHIVDDSMVYIGIISGKIHRSTDCGLTWKQMSTDSIKYGIYAMTTVNGKVIAGNYRSVFISDDNGLSWKLVHNDIFDGYIMSLVNIGDTVFAATSSGLMYRTTDDGETWETLNPVGCDIQEIYADAQNKMMLAATVENGVWRCSVNELNESAAATSPKYSATTPKKGTFRIERRGEHVSITISPSFDRIIRAELFNLEGRKVNTSFTSTFSPNSAGYSLTTHTLPAGCYTVRIITGGSAYNERIVVTH